MKLSINAFWLSCLGLVVGCAGGCGPVDPAEARTSIRTLTGSEPTQAARAPAFPVVTSACLPADGPIEQPADLGVCRRHHAPRPTDRDAAAWFQVVAEPGQEGEEPSTVTIYEATLYGIRADGSRVALAGTNAGQAPVVWAGAYQRSPWFGNDETGGDAFSPLPASESATYHATIPTGRTLLHGGPAHADITGYVDTVFIIRYKTTGTARVQTGIDYRPFAASGDINEVTLGDWNRSSAAGACVRATPRLVAPADCRPPTF